MSIHRFKYLFQQFVNKTATSEEADEFLSMIKSANYDQEMQVLLDEFWNTSEPEAVMDEGKAENIFNKILSSSVMRKNRARVKWMWFKTAAAVMIIGFGAFMYMKQSNSDQNAYVNYQNTNLVRSEIPSRRFINLPDGSSVILNEKSKIELSDKFGTNGKREVYLEGEAYFDIVHDSEHPFVVHAGNIETTVLGTAFNINSGAYNAKMSVTVIRGKVKVGDNKQTFDVIEPNEQLVFDKDLTGHSKRVVNAGAVIAWKNEDLYFDEVSLQDVANELSSRFNVSIVFSNELIKKCRFSATFLKSQNLEQILNVISEFNQIKYQIKGDKVFLDGQKCM